MATLEEQIRNLWGQYGNWNASGIDRYKELADVLRRAGVTDLSQLSFRDTPDAWTEYQGGNLEANDPGTAYGVTGRQLMVGDKPLGYLGNINLDDTIGGNESPYLQGGDLLSWSARGEGDEGNVSYRVVPGPGGQPIVVPVAGSSSDKETLKEVGMGALNIGLMAAGAGAFGTTGQTLAQGYNAANALYRGDYPAAFLAAAPLVSPYVPSEYTSAFKDVSNYAKIANDIAKAIENKDIGKLISLGGQYTDSEITKLIGRGVSAIQSGNPIAIANAARGTLEYFNTPDYQEMYNQPSYLPGYTDPDGFYVHPEQIERASLDDYGVQELGISPENWESYTKNLSGIGGMGGFTSTWQTVGSDRVMVQDDGTAIGINTETGDTYSLTPDEVTQLTNNGLLNSSTSGYTGAVSGPGIDFTTSTSNAGSGSTAAKGGTQQKQEDKKQPADTSGLGFDPKLFAMFAGMFGDKDEEKTPYQVADIDVESPFGRYV